MKKFLLITALLAATCIHAQSVTDSINTSIGDFVLVTSEAPLISEVYLEESIATTDGGNGEFVAIGSNARYMDEPVLTTALQIALAPNPTVGTTELQVKGMSGAATITVTNVLGQVVYSSVQQVNSSQTVLIPSQLWQSGSYLVVVSNGQDVKTERLIVE